MPILLCWFFKAIKICIAYEYTQCPVLRGSSQSTTISKAIYFR